MASPNKDYIPVRMLAVGSVFRYAGAEYEVVPNTCEHWSAACSGCSIAMEYKTCPSVACSAFDRADHQFVWFRRIHQD